MKFKSLAALTTAAAIGLTSIMAVGPVLGASHGMTPAEAIAARSAVMKGMGGQMRTLGSLEGDAMGAAADQFVAAFADMAKLFPEGSAEGTKALPVIWEDFAAFEAVIAKGAAVAAELKVAADAGDQAAFAAAAQKLGPVCGECHGTFRAQQ